VSTEGIEVADAPGGQSGGARAARLFAVVVITEASNAEQAKDVLQAGLGLGNGYLWVADAAPVGPAAEYELTEIRLSADGEPLVTTPDF
jgi:hypothetical protein